METEQQTEVGKRTSLSLPGAVIIAAVLIVGGIFASRMMTPVSTEEKSIPAVASVNESDFINGDEGAPLTLIEYADFSCGYCAHYHPTLHRVLENYPGKVRWVYRHLPIFNKPAAVVSQCVGNLLGDETFFAFADSLYAHQKEINQDFMKQEALRLGVDESQYESCINSVEVNNKISQDFSTVRILAGFNATPYTVLIDEKGNMHPFSGALPYEDLSHLIDSLLEN